MCFAATPKSTRPEANGKKINDYFKVGKVSYYKWILYRDEKGREKKVFCPHLMGDKESPVL